MIATLFTTFLIDFKLQAFEVPARAVHYLASESSVRIHYALVFYCILIEQFSEDF